MLGGLFHAIRCCLSTASDRRCSLCTRWRQCNNTIKEFWEERGNESEGAAEAYYDSAFYISSLFPNLIGPEIHHLLLTAGFIFMGVWLQVSEIYSRQEVWSGVWRPRQLKPPAIFKPGGEIQPFGTPVSAYGIRGAASSLDHRKLCVTQNHQTNANHADVVCSKGAGGRTDDTVIVTNQ